LNQVSTVIKTVDVTIIFPFSDLMSFHDNKKHLEQRTPTYNLKFL